MHGLPSELPRLSEGFGRGTEDMRGTAVGETTHDVNERYTGCETACDANEQYISCGADREEIFRRLREKGFRITKQRRALIDVILSGGCTCCKELYYSAAKKMPEIGMATAYRMLSVLEEIGAVKRESSFQICARSAKELCGCEVELENGGSILLGGEALKKIIEKGMECCGCSEGEKVKKITVKSCCADCTAEKKVNEKNSQ